VPVWGEMEKWDKSGKSAEKGALVKLSMHLLDRPVGSQRDQSGKKMRANTSSQETSLDKDPSEGEQG